MSKLGNIYLSYGHQFNIGVSNTYSYNILSGNNLPKNIIVISSPIDDENNDIGTYSLMCTDSLGNPVRLTYSIKEGNGLFVDNDVLYLNIDNETIKNSNGLYIDLSTIYSDIVLNENNILHIDNDKLSVISQSSRGVSKGDNNTIKNDEGMLYVDTENLQYSNNSTSTYGIITSSDDKILINNGVLSLNQDNLNKASNEEYGICHGDETTVSVINGKLQVNTKNLIKASESNYGIIDIDGNKILSNDGLLSINTDNLNIGDNNNIGVIDIDNSTIVLNDNNQITISYYDNIIKDIDDLRNDLNSYIIGLDKMKEDILSKIS